MGIIAAPRDVDGITTGPKKAVAHVEDLNTS
jgi:hypothetical protein